MTTRMDIMERDFEELAKQHDGIADNEYLWALGASDAETTKMHTDNMARHRMMAKMYRMMKEDTLALVETYDDCGC